MKIRVSEIRVNQIRVNQGLVFLFRRATQINQERLELFKMNSRRPQSLSCGTLTFHWRQNREKDAMKIRVINA